MLVIGLIKEGKIPADNRVALTPAHCRWLLKNVKECKITVQPSGVRCFSDDEYVQAGVELNDDLSACNLILAIKEVPVNMLLSGKTYMFFSHTRKKQPHNQQLFHAMIDKGITLIDYECMEHEDGQRIIGFGFFAGIVGAHNGIMAFGERTKTFKLERVFKQKDYAKLIHTYFGLKLPDIKIAVTGNGRVAHGILEIMNLMDVQEVEPEDYLSRTFSYPVYVHLKGADLYKHKENHAYKRSEFHQNPEQYESLFENYYTDTDILMNGIYWDANIPRLFTWEEFQKQDFKIQTIADITDDFGGSIPCNLGDVTIEEPVYGVDKKTCEKTAPYLLNSVDVMAVGNLPNELPRDASRYFGEQIIKYILNDILQGGSNMIKRATILKDGKLTAHFSYLSEYAAR
ncbi:MAG: NAD(P)-dependent oxidoreductase [Parafilimonas sp.]